MNSSNVQYRRLIKTLTFLRDGFAPKEDRLPELSNVRTRRQLANCNTIAGRLEVDPKTVQRDINYLRDELEVPIEYDPQAHGYYLTEDICTIPGGYIKKDDLCCLTVAEAMLNELGLTALGRTLGNLLDKAADGDADDVQAIRDSIAARCTVRDAAVEEVPGKILSSIAKAMAGDRKVLVFLNERAGDIRGEKSLRMTPGRLTVGAQGHTLTGLVDAPDGTSRSIEVPLSDLVNVIVLPAETVKADAAAGGQGAVLPAGEDPGRGAA